MQFLFFSLSSVSRAKSHNSVSFIDGEIRFHPFAVKEKHKRRDVIVENFLITALLKSIYKSFIYGRRIPNLIVTGRKGAHNFGTDRFDINFHTYAP